MPPFPWWEIAQHPMLDAMFAYPCKIMQYCDFEGLSATVINFARFNSLANLLCFMSRISWTVICQAFWSIAKAFFYRSWHDILHRCFVITSHAYGPGYGFTIATVQCERDTQFFAIITTELKAIGTPALVAFLHQSSAFMFPRSDRKSLSCNTKLFSLIIR